MKQGTSSGKKTRNTLSTIPFLSQDTWARSSCGSPGDQEAVVRRKRKITLVAEEIGHCRGKLWGE